MLFLIFTHREKESERALDNFCELDVLGTVFLVEEQLFEVIVKQGIKQKLLERYLSISNTLDPSKFSFDNVQNNTWLLVICKGPTIKKYFMKIPKLKEC